MNDNLARSSNLPEWLYILLVLISVFFKWLLGEQLSQYPLDRFSQSFHRMKAFWVQMIDLGVFFRYLKGRCHGNQFFEKMANSSQSSLWHSEMEWDIDTSVCALNVNDASISCKISWTLSSNSRVDRAHLWASGTTRPKKLAYLVEYLRIYWTDFRNFFSIWKCFGCRWSICTLFSNLSRDVGMPIK